MKRQRRDNSLGKGGIPRVTGSKVAGQKQKWLKVQADQIELSVTDERLDIESDDLLHEGSPVRFGIIPLGVRVNMAFSLPVVFGVGLKENKCPDDFDRPAS